MPCILPKMWAHQKLTKSKTWNIQIIPGGKGTIKMIGTQTSKLTALLSLAGVGEDTLLAAADPVAANIFLLGISPIIAASIVTSLWAVLPWTRDIGRREGREVMLPSARCAAVICRECTQIGSSS